MYECYITPTKSWKHSSFSIAVEYQESLWTIVDLKDSYSLELVEPHIPTIHSDSVVLIGHSCIGRNFDARHTETEPLFSDFEHLLLLMHVNI